MTELSFKGKEFVYNHHLAVPFRPLVPDAGKGIGPVALDGNLVIHGDNLHALKALLPMYAGRVDCIFIDPPYNTGNEGWCYNDNVNAPMIKEWLESNPVGIEDGLRHDKWCAMMWPRLRLLHEMLAESGSFWITLDDNEIANGRTILDEVFGSENFVACIVWQKRSSPDSDDAYVTATHDYILCYAKKKNEVEWQRLIRTSEADARYENPDNDPRGVWTSSDLTRREYREHDFYEIELPSGRKVTPAQGRSWSIPPESYAKLKADGRLWFGKDGNAMPRRKRFLAEVTEGMVPTTWWSLETTSGTSEAKKEINRLFKENPNIFATPKPTALLRLIIEIAANKGALILDSFAGSGTTAHAILAANACDGGNRRFILVEGEDYADALTAERVRRVINGYDFQGTQRTELLREKLNWRTLKNAGDLVHKVEGIENLCSHEYSCIKKEVKDDELIVIGEKMVTERADGLGGTFTYCTLGDSIELDKVLTGESLPPYAGLGAALFHMATSRALDPAAMRQEDFYLGATEGQHVWLIYKPDLDWLKSPEAALTLARAKAFAASDLGKRHLVFAPARYVSQKMLAEQNIPVEFVPLPYALYRIDRS